MKIRHLAVSPAEEQLVCTLANAQAYLLPLSNTDILKSEEMNFELLSQPRAILAQFWRNSAQFGAILCGALTPAFLRSRRASTRRR